MEVELLKQVVECAPKEMGANLLGVDIAHFSALSCHLYNIGSDMDNGSAIIAMLDELEKAGYECDLSVNISPGMHLERYRAVVGTEWLRDKATEIGETRAEAVAKAFVAVFATPPN